MPLHKLTGQKAFLSMTRRSLKSCTLVLAFCRQIDTLKRHRKNLSRAVMLDDQDDNTVTPNIRYEGFHEKFSQ